MGATRTYGDAYWAMQCMHALRGEALQSRQGVTDTDGESVLRECDIQVFVLYSPPTDPPSRL